MIKKSLLPPSLAPLERKIDSAAGRIENINIPIADLWDPMNCPASVLPYLAWALSVDQWESGWTEEIKRRVVSQSLLIHEIKGTRAAVERSLAALGIETRIVEWFETRPKGVPGTFEVQTFVKNRGVNEPLWREIDTAVRVSKNLRSHYRLTLNLLSEGSAAIELGLAGGNVGTLQPLQPSIISPSLGVAVGVAVQSLGRYLLHPFTLLPIPVLVPLQAGLALQVASKTILYPRIN